MSTYLYTGWPEPASNPITFSTTTTRFVLRLIKQWDKPELYDEQTSEDSGAWYSSVEPRREENQYSVKAFQQAQENLPKTLDKLIPFIKQHWDSREVLKMGIDIGSGEVTAELYLDALSVIDKAVAEGNDIYAM